jgi:hypothetical protein
VSPPIDDTTSTKPDFEWEELDYASTYDIQVATDENFDNIAKEFSGINNNRYRFFPRFEEGTQYYWHIRGVNEAGNGPWSEARRFITEGESSVDNNPLPKGFELIGCNPNPSDGNAVINIRLPYAAVVELDLFDISGNSRLRIASREFSAGVHTIPFNGGKLESGVYFCRMSALGGSAIIKLIIE